MKLLIIRHGDPDYQKDNLTAQGKREAKALSNRLASLNVKNFYVSPLGRAQATAAFTLEKVKRQAICLPWLEEFTHALEIKPPLMDDINICWDWKPEDWEHREGFYDKSKWQDEREMASGNIGSYYKEVTTALDDLIQSWGYKRENNIYLTEKGNNDTYVFFCHFGVECVLLSHLLNISPMVLWHGLCALPSSVTTLVTEERVKGKASFRMLSFGDLSHLYKENINPSFAGRFCECFDNTQERH